MDVVTVRCNSCGAPLEAGAQARFITCRFCNTQLEVKRTESSVFTEEMSRMARNTDQMAESLETIKLQNEIEMLDREAAAISGSDLSRNGPGSQNRPGGVLGLAFAVFFAIVCFSMAGLAGKTGAPGLFTLVPVGMGIFALVAATSGFLKSTDQAQKQDGIRRRREELARKLKETERQT
jgi:hypothetical protein